MDAEIRDTANAELVAIAYNLYKRKIQKGDEQQ